MTEFFNVLPPDEARTLLFDHIKTLTNNENLSVPDSLGRVTAQPVNAPHDLPSFQRSTMDGYAVKAKDTFGASSSLPAFLTVVGEVEMGTRAEVSINVAEAVIVHTGGMIPETADAVVQIEHSQRIDPGVDSIDDFEIEVLSAVAPGQNVIQIGEDIGKCDEILSPNSLIRPQDIGGMLALGITEVIVRSRPVVGLLSTGDEIVKPDAPLLPGQIRDINSYTIAALASEAGGVVKNFGIVPDDFQMLLEKAKIAIKECHMVVITAGSSVSTRDMTVEVIQRLGDPGVLLHGVATRPGKPTILGAVDGKPVLGLPGNPVSAVVQFIMFGVPAIYRLLGMTSAPPKKVTFATITQNLASESGREDYVPAKLDEHPGGLQATPIYGKSNLIFTLVRADGLIKIPLNDGGALAGDLVEVILF